MKVALVTEFYYPHLGGVTEHVHNLARQLEARGHTTLVLTSRMRGATTDTDGVRRIGRSRVIFSNGSFARVTTGIGLERRIEAQLREGAVDLVHLHGPLAPTLGLLAQSAADRLGVPVVGTFHSWFPRSAAYRAFRRPLQHRLDRMAALIAVSEPVVRALSRYLTGEWTIIPNGIDVDWFRPPPDGVDETRNGPQLLFLGRLDPRNGLGTVLEAMPQILARHPAAQLIVAGDGPLRRYYARRARALAPHVRFLGHVNGERPELYGGADLYLCPTTKASFGVTLLEAMACGTPIVGSDIIGFRELVDGGGEATLAPVSDPSAWAAVVTSLLADPLRRNAMGAAGRAKARRYAWPRIAERVLAVYRRAVADSGRRVS